MNELPPPHPEQPSTGGPVVPPEHVVVPAPGPTIEPRVPDGIESHAYDGTPDLDAFNRLNRLIGSARFHVELGRVYRLEDAAVAHREIDKHHLGKLAFRVHASGHA